MDIEKYASYHRTLLKNYKAEREKLNCKAYDSLSRIVDILTNKPTVTRAVIFGSLINGTFTKGSDIDIAVEGIPSDNFFTTWRQIEEETGMKIDLIDLNPDNIPIYNIIQKTGKVIYEKPK